MSPAATSAHPDLLKHPQQATFDTYRATASRTGCARRSTWAPALICRSEAIGQQRFGIYVS
jgi:hypothetical protein